MKFNFKHHEFRNFILRQFFGILGGLNQIALYRLILEFWNLCIKILWPIFHEIQFKTSWIFKFYFETIFWHFRGSKSNCALTAYFRVLKFVHENFIAYFSWNLILNSMNFNFEAIFWHFRGSKSNCALTAYSRVLKFVHENLMAYFSWNLILNSMNFEILFWGDFLAF